ncbi:MAG: glycosyltransferase family 39 protein [Chloroflexi bacterium]|nr:glycosyltransferase family 39 protein [Chloroflexota bacterium]
MNQPAAGSQPSGSTARVVVRAVLVLIALLAAVLLAASLVSAEMLAGRLLGAAGEARAGGNTQELVAHLNERLRLAGALLMLLVVGLTIWRTPFEGLVRTPFADLARPHWPARAEMLCVGVATIVAFGLRLAFVNQPMRYDESLTFNEFASRPLYYGLSFYPDPNNHLLNTLLVHFAFAGLGNQPWVLRLPAFVAGVLLVPATYWFTRLLYRRRAAFLAALLVGVSSYLVEYSTNSRGYTLQAVCFVVMLSLVTLATQRDSLSALLLAVLAAAAGAYAVPTMLYGVGVAAVWFGIRARGARLALIRPGHVIASALGLGLVVTLAYLPVIVVSGADKLVANRFVGPLDGPQLAVELPRSLVRTWVFWNRDLGLPIALLLLVGFGVATLDEVRSRRAPLGLLAPAICLGLVVLQRVAPFERVWLFLLPLYLGIASAGLIRLGEYFGTAGPGLIGLSQRRLPDGLGWAVALAGTGVLAFSTLTSGSILRSGETGTFPDAEAVARSLSSRLAPADGVVTTLPASLPELQYYFPRVGLSIETLVRPPAEAEHLYVVAAPDAAPTVSGWGHPEPIQRFPGAALLVLQRD